MEKKTKKKFSVFDAFIMSGIFISILLVCVFAQSSVNDGLRDDVDLLGGAICKEKYGAPFKYVYDGKIVCEREYDKFDGVNIIQAG